MDLVKAPNEARFRDGHSHDPGGVIPPRRPPGDKTHTKFHLKTLHLACDACSARRRGQTSGLYEATHDACGELRNVHTHMTNSYANDEYWTSELQFCQRCSPSMKSQSGNISGISPFVAAFHILLTIIIVAI